MPRRRRNVTLRELGLIALLAAASVWLVFLVIGIFHKEETARRTVAETRMELNAIDTRKDSLSGTIQNQKTERGQEASLRETYGVARPGEDVIVVVPKKEVAPPPAPLTFWDKVRAFFGH